MMHRYRVKTVLNVHYKGLEKLKKDLELHGVRA